MTNRIRAISALAAALALPSVDRIARGFRLLGDVLEDQAQAAFDRAAKHSAKIEDLKAAIIEDNVTVAKARRIRERVLGFID